MYPPYQLPASDYLDDVYYIALEYNMEKLMETMKLGIVKYCTLEPIVVAQESEKISQLLINAFAEFATEELKALPGYEHLTTSTKVTLALRRVQLLEERLEHKTMEPCRLAHAHLFRECPPELAAQLKTSTSTMMPNATRLS